MYILENDFGHEGILFALITIFFLQHTHLQPAGIILDDTA